MPTGTEPTAHAHRAHDAISRMDLASIVELRRVREEREQIRTRIDTTKRSLTTLRRRARWLEERERELVAALPGLHIPEPEPEPPRRRRRSRTQTRELIRRALPGTVAQISERSGVSTSSARLELRMMERAGIVARDEPEGPKRVPITYRLTYPAGD